MDEEAEGIILGILVDAEPIEWVDPSTPTKLVPLKIPELVQKKLKMLASLIGMSQNKLESTLFGELILVGIAKTMERYEEKINLRLKNKITVYGYESENDEEDS